MAEHGGKRPGAGRPKGSRNKRTQQVDELLDQLDCDPVEALVRLAAMAEEDAQACEDPKERLPFLNMARDCYKELANYRYPKRKATELSGSIGVGSHEEWLDSLK